MASEHRTLPSGRFAVCRARTRTGRILKPRPCITIVMDATLVMAGV
jgi:hypothetical protein